MVKPSPARDRSVTRDPDATREAILAAATHEFAQHGAWRVRAQDRIAERAASTSACSTTTSASKESLFLAVLERAYQRIRGEEQQLNLTQVEPVEAIRRLIAFTWNYYIAHPEFLSLLNSENLHRARHLKKSAQVRTHARRRWCRRSPKCWCAAA